MTQPARRTLRSNFEYGTYRWAMRRAHWLALGISDEDMEKPKIAVVNSSSELAVCFSHLDGIAAVVKEAVREAGGLPFEVRTTAPSDIIHGAGGRGGYILSSRELVANDIEAQVEGSQLDGMVCLTSCDKTMPGQLMAAMRLNIPTILVICGYQASGEWNGEPVDIEDVFIKSSWVAMGRLTKDELAGMCENAIQGPGVCTGMGTANTMHIAVEALGMSLPGYAPVAANSDRMFEGARASGRRIVDMVWEDLTPRKIITAGAIGNAARAVLAVAGSVNAVKHLQATAIEGEVDIDVAAAFNEAAQWIPVLSAVRPVGETTIEEFEAAGGTQALLKQLASEVDPDPITVTGERIGDIVGRAEVLNEDVIRPLTNPLTHKPGMVILRGSLAPESAIVKLGLTADEQSHFEGEAIVFDTSEDAMTALREGLVQPGHVLVLRGGGVKGGPAMAGGASGVVFALDGLGLNSQVAIVTDGQLSGLVNKGLVVNEVSPEGATGGPLALVEDGDRIVIDVDERRLDLDVPEDELQARRARWVAPPARHIPGWLGVYEQTVSSLSKGAVLGRG